MSILFDEGKLFEHSQCTIRIVRLVCLVMEIYPNNSVSILF